MRKDKLARGGTHAPMKLARLVLISLVLLLSLGGSAPNPAALAGPDSAQQKAEAILKQADARVASLRDFKADLKARAHFPLLPAFDLTGKLYFKRPNRLKVDVDNIPRLVAQVKQQMQTQPPYQNRKEYVPRYLRTEAIDGHVCDVIMFKARTPTTKLQSTTIWVDRASGTMPRTVLEYADGSQCTMNTTYARFQHFMLPSTSDVEMMMPAMRVVADVTYSNYLVNTNLPDSVFGGPSEKIPSKAPRTHE